MPECFFFSKYGECSNQECPYRHVDQEKKKNECPYYARGFWYGSMLAPVVTLPPAAPALRSSVLTFFVHVVCAVLFVRLAQLRLWFWWV
jgi:hypothetical protein